MLKSVNASLKVRYLICTTSAISVCDVSSGVTLQICLYQIYKSVIPLFKINLSFNKIKSFGASLFFIFYYHCLSICY